MNVQKGLGLPELLIGLFLSSLLMSLFVTVFIHQKAQHQLLMKRIERDEDLYLTADFMSEAIKMAGFSPCLSLQRLVTIDRRKANQPMTLIKTDNNQLLTSRMSSRFSTVEGKEENHWLRLGRNPSFKAGDVVVIADCYHAEVHEVEAVEHRQNYQRVQLKQPLFFAYDAKPWIGHFLEERWYIKPYQNMPVFYYELNHHAEQWSLQIAQINLKKIKQADRQFIQLSLQTLTGSPLKWTVMLRNLT